MFVGAQSVAIPQRIGPLFPLSVSVRCFVLSAFANLFSSCEESPSSFRPCMHRSQRSMRGDGRRRLIRRSSAVFPFHRRLHVSFVIVFGVSFTWVVKQLFLGKRFMWVPAIARPLSLFLLVPPLSTTSGLSFSFLLPVWFLFTALRACVYCVGCFHSSKCVHNIHLLRFRPFVNHYPPRVKSNGVLSAPPVFAALFPFAIWSNRRSRRAPQRLWFVFVWVCQEDSLAKSTAERRA